MLHYFGLCPARVHRSPATQRGHLPFLTCPTVTIRDTVMMRWWSRWGWGHNTSKWMGRRWEKSTMPNSHDTWTCYNDDKASTKTRSMTISEVLGMRIRKTFWQSLNSKKKYYLQSNRLECRQLWNVNGWLQLQQRKTLNERAQAHDQQTPSPNHLTTRMEWGLVINQVDDHRAEICEHDQFPFPICMYTSQP